MDSNQTIVFGGSNGEMQRYTVAEAMYLDGNINAAILYHYINGYCKHAKRDDGFVYLTADKIYSETAINKRKQDTAFKLLEQKGLLTKKRMYISGTTKSCLHFKTVDKVVVFANSQINKTSNCTNQQNVELYTNQQNVELFNISDHQSNHSSNHTYASSADATLAGVDKKEPTQVQSAVDEDSSLVINKKTPLPPTAKIQETVSVDRTTMLKKGNVFNPAAYALVANLAKKLGSHEGKPSKKVLVALRSVITNNPKLVENNSELFMKCAEQLAGDDYQVNLGNNNVEFLLNHISKYLNLAVKGGVQTNSSNSQSKKNNRGAIFVKY